MQIQTNKPKEEIGRRTRQRRLSKDIQVGHPGAPRTRCTKTVLTHLVKASPGVALGPRSTWHVERRRHRANLVDSVWSSRSASVQWVHTSLGSPIDVGPQARLLKDTTQFVELDHSWRRQWGSSGRTASVPIGRRPARFQVARAHTVRVFSPTLKGLAVHHRNLFTNVACESVYTSSHKCILFFSNTIACDLSSLTTRKDLTGYGSLRPMFQKLGLATTLSSLTSVKTS